MQVEPLTQEDRRAFAAADHASGCDQGWVKGLSDGLRACALCRPGQYALFIAGYYSDRANGRRWTLERYQQTIDDGYLAIGEEPPVRDKKLLRV